jgi:hypothetical protein
MGASTTSSNTDSGSYSGGGGGGGSNQSSHDERQENLKKKTRELEAKARRDKNYADAAKRLKEKQEREAKKFEARTTGSGKNYVQASVDESGSNMYGGIASRAADDYLVKTGQAKVGNYFRKEGGNFVRISKEEGERLYGKDPTISRSTIGNKESQYLKYGKSGSAMGSGDPTGMMTSTAISQEMLRSQNKTKGLILGGLSTVTPSLLGTVLRMEAGKAGVDYLQPEAAHADYMKGFEAKQSGKKYKSKRTAQAVVGQTISNTLDMLTGKRKKINGKSTAGSTILGDNNSGGLGN